MSRLFRLAHLVGAGVIHLRNGNWRDKERKKEREDWGGSEEARFKFDVFNIGTDLDLQSVNGWRIALKEVALGIIAPAMAVKTFRPSALKMKWRCALHFEDIAS